MQPIPTIQARTPPSRPRGRWRLVAITAFAVISCSASFLGCQQPVLVRQAALTQQPEPIPQPTPSAQPPATPALAAPATDQPPPEPLIGTTPLGAPSQPEPPPGTEVLTLEDLEQVALMNNPSLGRAQALI